MATPEEVQAARRELARRELARRELARRAAAAQAGPTVREPEQVAAPPVQPSIQRLPDPVQSLLQRLPAPPLATPAAVADEETTTAEKLAQPIIQLDEMTEKERATATIGAGAALIGVWALGWCITRRTLLAARPHLTRQWFGLFGRAEWRCSRCETPINLGVGFCRTCGQPQKWPDWVVRP